jgi:hypothetical protein
MRERTHKRKPIERRAWLVDHLRRVQYSCVMSDVSEGGARLELPLGVDVPQIFVLSLTPTGKVLRFCEVRWRRGNAIGVRFIEPSDMRQQTAKGEVLPASNVEWV